MAKRKAPAEKNSRKGSASRRASQHRQLRVQEAADLRVRGHTLAEIARRMRTSVATAHRYVRDALDAAAERRLELGGQILDAELGKLDLAESPILAALAAMEAWATLLRAAVADDADPVEIGALSERVDDERLSRLVSSLDRIMQRRAKLLGLDSPERQEITHRAETEDDMQHLTDAELLAIEQGRG